MEDNLLKELDIHVEHMFFETGRTLKEFTDTFNEEAIIMLENLDKEIDRQITEFPESHTDKFTNYKEKLAEELYKRHSADGNLDLSSLFLFFLTVRSCAKKQGMTIADYMDSTHVINLLEDEQSRFQRLLNNKCQLQDPLTMFFMLITAFNFYEALGRSSVLTQDDLSKMLRVDREIAIIREEVSTIKTTSETRIKTFKSNLERFLTEWLDGQKEIYALSQLLKFYKKQGKHFKNIEEFCKAAKTPPKPFRVAITKEFTLNSYNVRVYRNRLKYAGITKENFNEVYQSSTPVIPNIFE